MALQKKRLGMYFPLRMGRYTHRKYHLKVILYLVIMCNLIFLVGHIEIYIHRHMSIMKQFELRIQIYHSKCSFWNIFISQILNSLQASNVYCIPRYLITILEGDNLSFFAQSILKICKSFETKFCMSWVYYSPVRYMEEV